MRKLNAVQLFKHMEIVLGLAFLVLASAALLGAPPAPRAPSVRAFPDGYPVAIPIEIPVVVITGKRMTAEEKRTALVLF